MALETSHLYREIHEQPAALAALLRDERPIVAQLAAAIAARKVDYVVIAARGTSDNAGRYAQYLLGAVNGLMVTLATPGSPRSARPAASAGSEPAPKKQTARKPGSRAVEGW